MSSAHINSIDAFRAFSNEASYSMATPRTEVWVGDLDQGHAKELKVPRDIFRGMRAATNSVMRLAYNHKDHTIMMLAAKAPYILQGEKDERGGILLPPEGLKSCYILDAFRLPPKYRDPLTIPASMASVLNEKWVSYQSKLGDDTRSGYTLPRVRLDAETEVFPGERYMYVLKKRNDGMCDVWFTQLPDGKKDGLSADFNGVTRSICSKQQYAQAYGAIMSHWNLICSLNWDGRSINPGQGLGFAAKRMLEKAREWPKNNVDVFKRGLMVGSIFGAGGAVFNEVAAATAFGSAFVLTAKHAMVDESLKAAMSIQERRSKAKAKSKIEDYDYGESVLDYYLYPEFHHFNKLSPKVNLDKCSAEDIVLLNHTHCKEMKPANTMPQDGMCPRGVHGLFTRMDGGGYPSASPFLSRNTRANEYFTGLMRTKTLCQNGEVVMYGKFRKDINISPQLTLPELYQDQIGEQAVRIKWDRNSKTPFHDSFTIDFGLSVDEVVGGLNDIMFERQPHLDQSAKNESLAYVEQAFSKPNFACHDYMQETANLGYMSGQVATAPSMAVLQP